MRNVNAERVKIGVRIGSDLRALENVIRDFKGKELTPKRTEQICIVLAGIRTNTKLALELACQEKPVSAGLLKQAWVAENTVLQETIKTLNKKITESAIDTSDWNQIRSLVSKAFEEHWPYDTETFTILARIVDGARRQYDETHPEAKK